MQKNILKEMVDKRVKKFINQDDNSSPYLIMTIFGDSIIPHGGEIWLGSLVKLLDLFDINERLVRTSIFRLTKDTWLKSNKIGRKSFYSAHHLEEIKKNEQCLYYQQDKWDGNWRLLIGVSMEKASNKRDEFRKELLKNGFSSISSNVFAHPTFSIQEIKRLLEKHQQNDFYTLINARGADNNELDFLKVENVLCRSMKNKLEVEYLEFIKEYQPFLDRIIEGDDLCDEDCFLLKTLLVNDYRRLLWRDKIRSSLVMSDDWPGKKARHLTASIYCRIDKKGRRYFRKIGKCSTGDLPPIPKEYKNRFKHLL